MLNEYKEKIETEKEVLNTLPKNNIRNRKAFNKKIVELKDEYSDNKELLLKEIDKRRKSYVADNEEIKTNDI